MPCCNLTRCFIFWIHEITSPKQPKDNIRSAKKIQRETAKDKHQRTGKQHTSDKPTATKMPRERVWGGIGYFLTATLQNEVNIAFKVRAIFSLIARQKAFYR